MFLLEMKIILAGSLVYCGISHSIHFSVNLKHYGNSLDCGGGGRCYFPLPSSPSPGLFWVACTGNKTPALMSSSTTSC